MRKVDRSVISAVHHVVRMWNIVSTIHSIQLQCAVHVNVAQGGTDCTPVRWYTHEMVHCVGTLCEAWLIHCVCVQADAIVEAKLKLSDVSCALVVCSLIHQRYAEFSALLLDSWQKVLLTKKDDKVSTTQRPLSVSIHPLSLCS